MLILEILSCQLRSGIPQGRKVFCTWKPRLFTVGQGNLLEDSLHLSPPPSHYCIVQNLIKVAFENHIDLILSSRWCLGSSEELASAGISGQGNTDV